MSTRLKDQPLQNQIAEVIARDLRRAHSNLHVRRHSQSVILSSDARRVAQFARHGHWARPHPSPVPHAVVLMIRVAETTVSVSAGPCRSAQYETAAPDSIQAILDLVARFVNNPTDPTLLPYDDTGAIL